MFLGPFLRIMPVLENLDELPPTTSHTQHEHTNRRDPSERDQGSCYFGFPLLPFLMLCLLSLSPFSWGLKRCFGRGAKR